MAYQIYYDPNASPAVNDALNAAALEAMYTNPNNPPAVNQALREIATGQLSNSGAQGQTIYSNLPGSTASVQGPAGQLDPPIVQSDPYAQAVYYQTPWSVNNLVGYPSRVPHVLNGNVSLPGWLMQDMYGGGMLSAQALQSMVDPTRYLSAIDHMFAPMWQAVARNSGSRGGGGGGSRPAETPPTETPPADTPPAAPVKIQGGGPRGGVGTVKWAREGGPEVTAPTVEAVSPTLAKAAAPVRDTTEPQAPAVTIQPYYDPVYMMPDAPVDAPSQSMKAAPPTLEEAAASVQPATYPHVNPVVGSLPRHPFTPVDPGPAYIGDTTGIAPSGVELLNIGLPPLNIPTPNTPQLPSAGDTTGIAPSGVELLNIGLPAGTATHIVPIDTPSADEQRLYDYVMGRYNPVQDYPRPYPAPATGGPTPPVLPSKEDRRLWEYVMGRYNPVQDYPRPDPTGVVTMKEPELTPELARLQAFVAGRYNPVLDYPTPPPPTPPRPLSYNPSIAIPGGVYTGRSPGELRRAAAGLPTSLEILSNDAPTPILDLILDLIRRGTYISPEDLVRLEQIMYPSRKVTEKVAR